MDRYLYTYICIDVGVQSLVLEPTAHLTRALSPFRYVYAYYYLYIVYNIDM